MWVWNTFVIMLLTYYTKYIIDIIMFRNKRTVIQSCNKELNELRKKSFKTLEEQKRFITLKEPKHKKFSFKIKSVPIFLIHLLFYVILFSIWFKIFNYFNISFSITLALLFIVFFPMIINLILEKLHLQKDDLRYMIKWW